MKMILFLLAVCMIHASCTYRCYPSKRSKDWAEVHLKDDGRIAQDYWKTTLIKQSKTMKGFKCLFLRENGDTVVRFFQCPLEVNRCYWVMKSFSHG